jgi:hypothetical protein
MKCRNCGQEMETSEDTVFKDVRRPDMCPNVAIFMDHCLMDTLTGETYVAATNPIHCTDRHVHHAELERKEFEDDNAEWEHEDGPNDRD